MDMLYVLRGAVQIGWPLHPTSAGRPCKLLPHCSCSLLQLPSSMSCADIAFVAGIFGMKYCWQSFCLIAGHGMDLSAWTQRWQWGTHLKKLCVGKGNFTSEDSHTSFYSKHDLAEPKTARRSHCHCFRDEIQLFYDTKWENPVTCLTSCQHQSFQAGTCDCYHRWSQYL